MSKYSLICEEVSGRKQTKKLCEKLFTASAQETEQAIVRVKSKGAQVTEAFMYRHSLGRKNSVRN
jgi:hypothetical protein